MTKNLLIAFIFWTPFVSISNEVKTDSTIVLTLDDFTQTTTYPLSSNTDEVSVIIKNRSKIDYLFSLRKNNTLVKFISVPSIDSHSETIKVNKSDMIELRPLSPPEKDVKIFPYGETNKTL